MEIFVLSAIKTYFAYLLSALRKFRCVYISMLYDKTKFSHVIKYSNMYSYMMIVSFTISLRAICTEHIYAVIQSTSSANSWIKL